MCHAKEKVYTPTDSQPNTIYYKTCILVHGSRNGILLPVCLLYPVCQWYECSGFVFWSLVPLMMVRNNIKICRIINTVTIVNWECNYMACNWMLVVKYMGDINQFKIFFCLQIHVLYHPMSIFLGKKMVNLWWESCLCTTNKCHQINYKLLILFLYGKSSKLFQRWEWIFGFCKMQEILWLTEEPQERFCCELWVNFLVQIQLRFQWKLVIVSGNLSISKHINF